MIVVFSCSISPSVARRLRVDLGAQRLVGLRLEVAERQLLELVLHLAHAEPVGDRRVDVARLLGDRDAPLLGQVVERPHVVQPVGELDEDDADVVDHRQQHLAEVLGLPLLARREADGADLGDPFDDVGDLGAEQLLDPLDGGQRVLDDVVEEAGGDGDGVELHVGQEVGDGEGVDQVGLAGMADLSPVLEGREDVGPPEQLDVGVRAVGPDFFEEILEANHEIRCLTISDRDGYDVVSLHCTDLVLAASLYWPGFGFSQVVLWLLRGLNAFFVGSIAGVVAMLALGSFASTVGCAKVGEMQAKKAFKAANAAYQQQDYKKAAELYEETIAGRART